MNAHLVLLLALTGCTESGNILDVSFDRLDVNDIDWTQVDTDFVFRIDNPNPVGITMARFDYALSFSDVEWLSGDDPDGLEVLASDSSEVALPALIGFESLYEMVQATRGEDDIPFALAGSFGFDTALGSFDLPYAADGQFPALRTPAFELDRIHVSDYDLTSATIDVDFAVDNDHASNLWFVDFDYDLELEGVSVASGVIDDLGGVAGGTTDTLTIPVELDFVDVGTGIYEAIVSERIDVAIAANTDVDTPFGIVPLSIDESGKVYVDL